MVKQTYDDPAKQKWRDAWYQFIRKNKHFIGRNPRTWNIAFFPGQEALELSVYDKLKIPRENLLGLERDPRVHEKLRKKDLGIRLTDNPIDALDFFKTTDEKFDIINLDYTGNLNEGVLKTLENIAGRQLLEEDSLFGITIYGKRENRKITKAYALKIEQNEIFNSIDNMRKENLKVIGDPNELDTIKFLEERGYSDKKQIRDFGITQLIYDHVGVGLGNLEINPIFKRCPKFSHYCNLMKKEMKRNMTEENEEKGLRNRMNTIFIPFLSDHFKERGFNSKITDYLAWMAIGFQNKQYHVRDMKRYNYISNKGALMISDFFHFTQQRKIFEKYRYLAEHAYLDAHPKDFKKSILKEEVLTKKSNKKYHKLILKDSKFLRSFNSPTITQVLEPRIHLGSSAKLPKLTGKGYYEKRFEDNKKGIPVEETHDRLIETFKVTRSQLPRFEAHYTMETHGPRYVPLELEVEEAKEDPKETLEKSLINDQFITQRSWKRLSENRKKRLEYFINEDLQRLNLGEEQLTQFAQNINESKLYNENNNITDSQFYAFFDDLLLESITKSIPSSKRVNTLYGNVKRPNWKKDYPRTMKPLLTLNKYKQLRIKEGKNDEWILKNYRTEKPNSLRAYKAWVTINNKKKMANPIESSPSLYVDSHGIVHRNPKNISDIEKGYK